MEFILKLESVRVIMWITFTNIKGGCILETKENMNFRKEHDSVGSHDVPVNAYYGVQSIRAQENFPITGYRLNPTFIKSMAYVKKAAAKTNGDIGQISQEVMNAMIQACDEILDNQWLDEFIVDPIQGGAGTSMNMNINEVIANRANEILGGKKGDYDKVHPNDHANYGQSTNDVIPTAGKLTVITLCQGLRQEMVRLKEAFDQKAQEFSHVIKMGRTQMQDAIPIRLGQEFEAYSVAIERNIQRLDKALEEMYVVNLAGTAIGTGLNADINYVSNVVPNLAEVSGIKVTQAENLIDGTQHVDSFALISSTLKNFAISISKIANDLRLLSSGPKTGFNEINLPKKQNGSSIMPGKVNPVIPEVVNQVAFRVVGNDATITMAVEAGQLELNAFEPVIFYALFESISILEKGIATWIDNCILGITTNEEHTQNLVDNSIGIITAIVPSVGYQKAAEIANEALSSGRTVKELILEQGILTEDALNSILDPVKMTSPGIHE